MEAVVPGQVGEVGVPVLSVEVPPLSAWVEAAAPRVPVGSRPPLDLAVQLVAQEPAPELRVEEEPQVVAPVEQA